MRDIKDYMIHHATGIKTANFTAATTDVITSNAHGLRNGEMVVLSTTDTLPAGLAISTVYWVIEAATNTFKLSAISVPFYTTGLGGAGYTAVDVTDTGTGTHTFTVHDIGRNIYCGDHRHALVTIHSDGGADAAMVVKLVGSYGKSVADPLGCPDFSAAASATNRFDYMQAIDHQSGLAVAGDTGLTFSSADDHRQFMVNVDGLLWLNAIISSWTAGEVTVSVRLFND